jgi:hypothetical protein
VPPNPPGNREPPNGNIPVIGSLGNPLREICGPEILVSISVNLRFRSAMSGSGITFGPFPRVVYVRELNETVPRPPLGILN